MLRCLKLLTVVSAVLFISSCSTVKEKKYVTIVGEVHRPGDYFITKKVPFILLLLQARGYTVNANSKQVILERNSKSMILDLNISKDNPPPHLAETFMIYPYDRITVPQK